MLQRAAFITRNFFKTQNPLMNESSFKSRAAYDGVLTVNTMGLLDRLLNRSSLARQIIEKVSF
jgi:hypothetical protein